MENSIDPPAKFQDHGGPPFDTYMDAIDSELFSDKRKTALLIHSLGAEGQRRYSKLKELTNCGIRHVTVPIETRILIANVRHIGVSNICVINLVYFKMQV